VTSAGRGGRSRSGAVRAAAVARRGDRAREQVGAGGVVDHRREHRRFTAQVRARRGVEVCDRLFPCRRGTCEEFTTGALSALPPGTLGGRAGVMIFDLSETVEQSSPAPFTFSRLSGWLSGYEPDTPPGSTWVVPYKRTTQGTRLLPARSTDFGSAPGIEEGGPRLISPLRFNPGTPFLDQHITDVFMARPDAGR